MCCRRLAPYQISKQPLAEVLPGYVWRRTTNNHSFETAGVKPGEDYYVLSPKAAANGVQERRSTAPARSRRESESWVLKSYDRGDGKPIAGYSPSDAWARGQAEFERKFYAGVYGKY